MMKAFRSGNRVSAVLSGCLTSTGRCSVVATKSVWPNDDVSVAVVSIRSLSSFRPPPGPPPPPYPPPRRSSSPPGRSSRQPPPPTSGRPPRFNKAAEMRRRHQHQPFRPRRRPPPDYRPAKAAKKRHKDWSPGNDQNFVHDSNVPDPEDELDLDHGELGADVIREIRRDIAEEENNNRAAASSLLSSGGGTVGTAGKLYDKLYEDDAHEDFLRMADYYSSEIGSSEDLIGERRAMARDLRSEADRKDFLEGLDAIAKIGEKDIISEDPFEIENAEKLHKKFRLCDDADDPDGDGSYSADQAGDEDTDVRDPLTHLDPNQKAYGDWSELIIAEGRTVKLYQGGRIESYRALVIGGNLNGCGGFAIGKASDPAVAVDVASRKCKKNVFFVDRHRGDALTRDLVGRHNRCIVHLRATRTGLAGSDLCREILKRIGITNCTAYSIGRGKNPWNIVPACFKALMTHESMEEIAMKRGKRFVTLDRAMRSEI